MSDKEMIAAEQGGALTDLSHLPPALRDKILAASEVLKGSAPTSVNRIKLKAVSYTFPDDTKTSEFEGIIVAAKHANIHYANAYTAGVLNPVNCFAVKPVGQDVPCRDLTPHELVKDPFYRNCRGCEKFEFGSAAQGAGKACHEHVLLAVYIPTISDEFLLLEEKKKNAQDCDNYLATVNSRYGHPMMVRTKFTIGEKTDWAQTFHAVDVVSGNIVSQLAERLEEADMLLSQRPISAFKEQAAVDDSEDDDVGKNKARKPKE